MPSFHCLRDIRRHKTMVERGRGWEWEGVCNNDLLKHAPQFATENVTELKSEKKSERTGTKNSCH